VTENTKAAVLSMLRSSHQAIEAAMRLLAEPQEPAQPEKRVPPVMGGSTAEPWKAT
jgi:hypothetical protein